MQGYPNRRSGGILAGLLQGLVSGAGSYLNTRNAGLEQKYERARQEKQDFQRDELQGAQLESIQQGNQERRLAAMLQDAPGLRSSYSQNPEALAQIGQREALIRSGGAAVTGVDAPGTEPTFSTSPGAVASGPILREPRQLASFLSGVSLPGRTDQQSEFARTDQLRAARDTREDTQRERTAVSGLLAQSYGKYQHPEAGAPAIANYQRTGQLPGQATEIRPAQPLPVVGNGYSIPAMPAPGLGRLTSDVEAERDQQAAALKAASGLKTEEARQRGREKLASMRIAANQGDKNAELYNKFANQYINTPGADLALMDQWVTDQVSAARGAGQAPTSAPAPEAPGASLGVTPAANQEGFFGRSAGRLNGMLFGGQAPAVEAPAARPNYFPAGTAATQAQKIKQGQLAQGDRRLDQGAQGIGLRERSIANQERNTDSMIGHRGAMERLSSERNAISERAHQSQAALGAKWTNAYSAVANKSKNEATNATRAYDTYVKQQQGIATKRGEGLKGGDPEKEDWGLFDPATAAANLAAVPKTVKGKDGKFMSNPILQNPSFQRQQRAVQLWTAAQEAQSRYGQTVDGLTQGMVPEVTIKPVEPGGFRKSGRAPVLPDARINPPAASGESLLQRAERLNGKPLTAAQRERILKLQQGR